MDPSTRVLRSAIATAVCLAALGGAIPSAAQRYDASLQSLDYAPDPSARSPRLLGMGRLTLADDLHNRITLWDFAGNPTGIAEAESLSVFEYRPVIRRSSVVRDVPVGAPVRERQELSARALRHGIETWRRAPGTTAYGLTAEVATLQVDRPFGDGVEQRGRFSVPAIAGAINGRVPWLRNDRFDYALRLGYSLEKRNDGYFEFLRLPQGDYMGQETATVPAPDLFTPDHSETSDLRGGVGFSMRLARGVRAAINYDRARVRVRSTLEGLRSTSNVDEDRPISIGQASFVGRFGPSLEWGADGRAWRSRSEEFYFWSVSAGPTQAPISGSGKRLDRRENGGSLRARGRWVSGSVELGAAVGTGFRRSIIDPWSPAGPGDEAGFNNFLDEVGSRLGADTLLLPARIRRSQVEERSLEFSGGGSWRLPGERGVLGAEFHRSRRKNEQPGIGSGPEPTGWDVRVGGEYRCNETLVARAGWNHGIADGDNLTADNASRRTLATTGFGYQPEGARWSVDLGYAYAWARPDFVDPARSRGAEQHLAAQVRWPF